MEGNCLSPTWTSSGQAMAYLSIFPSELLASPAAEEEEHDPPTTTPHGAGHSKLVEACCLLSDNLRKYLNRERWWTIMITSYIFGGVSGRLKRGKREGVKEI